MNRPGGGNGFNPDIEPEQTLGLEIGTRGTLLSSALTFDLTLYRLWISDLLFPYQLEANGPTYYRNQGETSHRGIEASLRYDLSGSLQADITYTLTDAEFVLAETLDNSTLKGKKVPGVAEHRLSGVVRWRPGSLWLSAHPHYVSEYPVDNLNTAYNPAYFVVDVRASYHRIRFGDDSGITPFLSVNNLLDASYNGSVVVNAFGGRYYEPAAGINWKAGISVEF